MSLYNKYRPKSFDDMRGNYAHMNDVLKSDTHSQVFLFVGPPGCGKTTAAYILARMAGAADLDCQYYNFADTRGIDTARQIIEDSRLRPLTPGGAKAYVIDEFHQTTSEASDALLDVLENPPAGTYFVLCTSEGQKVKPSIRSRCAVYDFPPLGVDDLTDLVEDVCDAEDYKLSTKEIDIVVDLAQGSAREALVLLEQVGDLDAQGVAKVFEGRRLADNAEVIDLCRQLFGDCTASKLRDCLKALKVQKIDAEGARRAILGYGASTVLNTGDARHQRVLECFMDSVFNTGFPGLVVQCLRAAACK